MRLVKPVEIDLDRPRKLVEDFNAYAAFEEVTGKNALDPRTFRMPVDLIVQVYLAAIQDEGPTDLDDILVPDFEAMDASVLSAWLWACLLDDDPELSLTRVRKDLITPQNLSYIYLKLMELRESSLPESEAKEPDAEGEAPSPSPGETSGGSGSTTSGSLKVPSAS